MKKKKILIVCGGPSAERGISLNSARSLYDNFDKEKYDISLIYFNPILKAYEITPKQIYSNTPLDFDYKLHHGGKPLSSNGLLKKLEKVDVVFPAIHGTFGEDGQLQHILDKAGVKYIGSGEKACKITSNKDLCQKTLKKYGFYTIEGHTIKNGGKLPTLKNGKYVVKPLHGGSSIGVQYFSIPEDSKITINKKLNHVFEIENEAIIEPFCDGTEFTVIVIENDKGQPVALYPTEIEFNFDGDKFFNYRKKYLATDEIRYHTPARFKEDITDKIREEAQRAYLSLGMKDFARIDGWLNKDGSIWFSDINAISGMEQNSFLFQQAALFGISHRQLLDYLINKKIDPPTRAFKKREEIPVIFGGKTAERQVSVMSGTNVWMKLKSSKKYKPVPLFLTSDDKIFHIPQFLCLHHTVEEIEEKISKFQNHDFYKSLKKKQKEIFKKLKISENSIEEDIFVPEETDLDMIAANYKFLFLGLHGGDGENGTIQHKLEKLLLPFNGPGSESSAICMDKYLTGRTIMKAGLNGIRTAKKIIISLDENTQKLQQQIIGNNFVYPLILKPIDDGCSAGVIRIDNSRQFQKAVNHLKSGKRSIPENSIHSSHPQIELPKERLSKIMVEEFIRTDKVNLKNLEIEWKNNTDLIEVTVGVMGESGKIKSFYPSQTIANQDVLSLEEKFMGGTGVNLTPPPEQYVNPKVIREVQKRIIKVAEILKIEGYSRIDTFMNRKTGEIIVIEANSLPGLTPSTVIFHQALAGPVSMTPLNFIEEIIKIGQSRYKKKLYNDRKPGSIFKTPEIESFEKNRI